ncbi:MAG: hypothetical protein V3V14_07160 [Saprospiraceae bacterium]
MIIKRYFASWFFVWLTVLTYGQSDDTVIQVMTDSIEIINSAVVNNTQKLESILSNSTLVESMECTGFGVVRSGGPGLISTILYRGMASRHIGLLWSGFNIQSVVNGTYDAGLLKNTIGKAQYLSPSISIARGNASMGGAIDISPSLGNHNRTEVILDGGSDANFSLSVNNNITLSSYRHQISCAINKNANKYTYINGNNDKVKQTHAQMNQWDVSYHGKVLLSDHLSMNGNLWFQNSNRDIAPTKTSVYNAQRQEDENYRIAFGLDHYPCPSVKVSLKSAYFNEIIHYEAPGVFSKSNADIYNFALDASINNNLAFGYQYRLDDVNANFFHEQKVRSTIALYSSYKIYYNKLTVSGALRPEWVNGSFKPVTVNISSTYHLSSNMKLIASITKNYTLPSFNDLYWPQGGQLDLLQESSINFDIGIELVNNSQNELLITGYYNSIDNWIQWIPIDGLFRPINQRKVRNMGVEIKGKKSVKSGKNGLLNILLIYALTDSRLVAHYTNPDLIGKRSIFVPVHKMVLPVSYNIDNWKFVMSPLYYSKRYDTTDNSSFVKGYIVVDSEIQYSTQLTTDYKLALSFKIENTINANYENIRFYPMPLRLFRFGIRLYIH